MHNATPIKGDAPRSFAWSVLHERHPALLARVRDGLPYEPATQQAIDRLGAEVEADVILPLDDTAHDAERWHGWAQEFYGLRYSDVPFFWAENFFYRKLLGAVGFFAPGPWQGVDPFGPVKQAELASPALAESLRAFDELTSLPPDDVDAAVLRAALWGNRADLGFLLMSGERDGDGDMSDLVVDDTALIWETLARAEPGTVCVVTDNAGRELLSDFALIDHLLVTGRARAVALHVKPSPYFTSDATPADVLACLRFLRERPGRAGEIGERVWQALRAGRLALRTDSFYSAPLTFHELPERLAAEFANASLTILKGDLNYRRLVGDVDWPGTSDFAELTRYFPGPVATLRTCKCDVVVGVDAARLAELDAREPGWRVDGAHALVQVRA